MQYNMVSLTVPASCPPADIEHHRWLSHLVPCSLDLPLSGSISTFEARMSRSPTDARSQSSPLL